MITGSSLGIGVTMFLRDQFSGPAAKIKGAASDASKELQKMQEDQLRHTRNMNAGLAFAGVAALRGMGRMIEKASEYGYMMQFIATATGAGTKEQKQLEEAVLSSNRSTIFSSMEIAKSMREMALAGLNAREIIQTIGPASKLAMATMESTDVATDILMATMRSFNIDMANAASVTDLLSKAAIESMIDLKDLGESLNYVKATSSTLGISLQETTAMIMALGNAGIKGSMAGVSLENMMRYLALSMGQFGSANQKKALSALGLTMQDITDQKGNMLSMLEVMEKIGMGMNRIFGDERNVDKQSVLSRLFGIRGKRSAAILANNLESFRSLFNKLKWADGSTETVVRDLMKELNASIKRAGNELGNVWIKFTEAITPILQPLIYLVTKVAEAFTWLFKTPYLGEFFSAAIAGFIAIKTVTFTYRALVAGLALLHMQAGTSATSMAYRTNAAYMSMTASQKRYVDATMAGNVRMSMGSGIGMMGGLFGGGGKGRIIKNSAGRWINSATGRYVSAASVGIGARLASRVGGSVIGGAVGGAIGRIAGVLTGPWGMVIAFVLPGLINMLIRALTGNRDSVDENSKALTEAARQQQQKDFQYTRMGHVMKFTDLNAPVLKVTGTTTAGQEGLNLGSRNPDEFEKKLQLALAQNKGYNGDLIINLDGDKIFSKKIEEILNRQLQSTR